MSIMGQNEGEIRQDRNYFKPPSRPYGFWINFVSAVITFLLVCLLIAFGLFMIFAIGVVFHLGDTDTFMRSL